MFFKNKSCFIIAELSANHNHKFERAVQLIEEAAACGADAVKLQTYLPETNTINCRNKYFQISGTIWNGKNLYDLYKDAYMPWEWQEKLFSIAREKNIFCFSTAYEKTALDFLETINNPCYKISSFEVIDIPFLQKVASTGKPVIMSTGMASLAEIDEAVTTLRENGTTELALLKCTSAYPAPPEEANLRTIPHLAQAFNCVAGLSDHTLGSAVAVGAVAVGARIIEKHFTLARADGGPDSTFSMEPHEFRQMVQDIRTVEKALGAVCYDLTPKQKESKVFRRSLFVVKDMKAGDIFTEENVRSIRPGYGLPPKMLEGILGKQASQPLSKGTPLTWEHIC